MDKPVKRKPLFTDDHGRQRRFGSATWNNYELGQAMAEDWAKDLPRAAYQIFFALLKSVGSHNYINVRLRELAVRCGLSIGSVQKAMRIFENKRLVVRTSLPHHPSVWMMNPEFMWNSRHDKHAQAVGNFKRLCYEANERSYAKAKKKAESEQEINDISDIRDTMMPIDFDYLEMIDDEETIPCELKSKAA